MRNLCGCFPLAQKEQNVAAKQGSPSQLTEKLREEYRRSSAGQQHDDTANDDAFSRVRKKYERSTPQPVSSPTQPLPELLTAPKTSPPQDMQPDTTGDSKSNSSQDNSGISNAASCSSVCKLKSETSSIGRPQPAHELEERIWASQTSKGSTLVTSPMQTATQPLPPRNTDKGSAKSEKGKAAKKSADSAPALSKSRFTGSFGKHKLESIGNPVKQHVEFQTELESVEDPLERNPFYVVKRALNSGSSGTVYHCVDLRNNEEVAIKLVSRGVTSTKAAEREISNLRLCSMHPYIIHMREVFLTTEKLALAFEYASGGNLSNYIETFQSSKPGRGLSEERSRIIFQQIVVAIDFCHKMGIANRDIKLENVLLVPVSSDPAQPPMVKLCDFGFSKDENADSLCKTACGTPECVAPEVLCGQLYDGKASDIWSLGVLLFAMLTGTYPFSRKGDDLLDNNGSLRKLFSRIAQAQYCKPHHISRLSQDLLSRMFRVNPEERITIAEILVHPWFGSALSQMASNVNDGLLEMPDSMLTGFVKQSEGEIAAILKLATYRTHAVIASEYH